MGRSNCDYTTKLTSVNDWASLDRQRQKLRDERNATMAKLLRLSKQERCIDEREKAMIERGLASLDDLDTAENAEREERARQEAAASALDEATTFLSDPLIDPESFADLPDTFWGNLGFVGGTVVTGPDS